MQKQTKTETWARRHSSLLGAFYVDCFCGDQILPDRFVQRYTVEMAKIAARRQGHSCTEQSLADGSIKLTVQIGGTV